MDAMKIIAIMIGMAGFFNLLAYLINRKADKIGKRN